MCFSLVLTNVKTSSFAGNSVILDHPYFVITSTGVLGFSISFLISSTISIEAIRVPRPVTALGQEIV